MPKLMNQNPKLGQKEGRAVVRYKGKTIYLKKQDGTPCKPGTRDALAAYNRLCLELQSNPDYIPSKQPTPSEEPNATLKELAGGYLTYSKVMHSADYRNIQIIVVDFLLALFDSTFPADSFTPKSLKKVQEAMILSQRFSRGTINNYTRKIVGIFAWGVTEGLVQETTHRALKLVRQLKKGHPGTWDNKPRHGVSFAMINRLLPFLIPMLRAMVQIQGLQGMRSGEICNMRVGEIDRSREHKTGFWYYTPAHHKTLEATGKETIFPLGKFEQELLLPYLEGKSGEDAVFSPAQAMRERADEKRASRKTKVSPAELARSRARVAKPRQYAEFYSSDNYRTAVQYGIAKANKQLPEGEKIPHWFPYQLRHAAITRVSLMHGKDAAQALAGHTSATMTDNYDKSQLRKREKIARKRKNPFVR